MQRSVIAFALSTLAIILTVPGLSISSEEPERCGIWVDLYSGEPVTYEGMLDDLVGARVIYLGERHTLVRHHEFQEQIIRDLASRGADLAVGIEMLPAVFQGDLDEYNTGLASFDELAEKVAWENLWENYEQYRGSIEAGKQCGAPILALNAESDLVREVAMKGFAGLDSTQASRLPPEISTDQPEYERELSRVMMVMAHVTGQTDMLKRMFEAQVTRDETMADAIAGFLESPEGQGRKVVVLCGSGHVSYGYGIPSRVRRRVADVTDRIVVFSESGDVILSEREQAMARAIEITHEQLRENTVPYADYVHAKALAPETPAEALSPEPGAETRSE